MKETDEGTSKLKAISHSWIRRIIIIKMPLVPEASTDSVQSLSQLQWHFSQK